MHPHWWHAVLASWMADGLLRLFFEPRYQTWGWSHSMPQTICKSSPQSSNFALASISRCPNRCFNASTIKNCDVLEWHSSDLNTACLDPFVSTCILEATLMKSSWDCRILHCDVHVRSVRTSFKWKTMRWCSNGNHSPMSRIVIRCWAIKRSTSWSL